jgi:hypothetical protein
MLALNARACLGACQPVFKDYALRWVVIVITGSAVALGLQRLGVAVAFEALRPKLLIAGLLLIFATVYRATGRLAPRAATRAAIMSDLALSILQLLAMVPVLLPMTYMAALPGLPLLDGQLARLERYCSGSTGMWLRGGLPAVPRWSG